MEIALRRFLPIPRATKKFERLYKGRTAVERVNGRLKVFWGADDGNLTGSRRFQTKIGAVMIVHAALAPSSPPPHDAQGSSHSGRNALTSGSGRCA